MNSTKRPVSVSSPHRLKRRPIEVSRHHTSRREFLKLSGLTVGSALFATLGDYASASPAASTPSPPPDAPNIILVIVDALRSDHVSANGYARTTTPNLDTWIADQGVSFHDATTTSPWTFPANAAMMTGQGPARLNATWDNTTLPANVMTLANYLHQAGYYTAGFVSAAFIRGNRGFAQGFDLYNDQVTYGYPTSSQGNAQAINHLAMSWLQNSWTPGSQPLFLFLYYFDPHTWYNPPPPYDTFYDPSYTGPLTPDMYGDGQDVIAGLIIPTPRDVEHLLALYDGEISYWDAKFGEMLTYLQGQQLLDNALVIVTADHGDTFGEHAKWTHGNCLYDEVLRVPLLMRYPGIISPGTAVNTPVQNMDLMPTVLDWLGIPIPPDLQAVSLRVLIEGGTGVIPRDIFSEVEGSADPSHWAYWLAPRSDLRSIQRNDWKFILHVGNPSADELYQLHPHSIYETDNLIVSEPTRAQELRQATLQWFNIPPYQSYLPCTVR